METNGSHLEFEESHSSVKDGINLGETWVWCVPKAKAALIHMRVYVEFAYDIYRNYGAKNDGSIFYLGCFYYNVYHLNQPKRE